ncbi:hypothetical protein PPL_02283 [Heterostelium album PN500]|uniref:Uncharacterized protein n=1 Tax=Heterostelium pallidum (strain ATCC 26659 / Pp 5 / PN500) TaxID=670386 RepID=D3B1V8_HETP5|nr:hypothetical protein PPL_02283 [Heterostelium album PN500]EFA85282.1 hypothetical protein PPL_02283 [Heterostelium album PN500]|eukprot:XP_020437391.1 hypothetical protein PPL_02283 [Heterostelium album PN500]
MKVILTVLLFAAIISCCSAKKPPKYINYVPHDGINCTGPISGHGTSYLLDKCIPFEYYALKYSIVNGSLQSYFYMTQNCTGQFSVSASSLDTCYRFRNGYVTNPYFYAYLSATKKAIKPPKQQLTLYMKSYDQSNTRCKKDFNWSKYVTNGTSWLLIKDISETLYCNSQNQPIELICNTTSAECFDTNKYADCDPFPEQLSNLVAKCKGPNPQYNDDSDSEDEDEQSFQPSLLKVAQKTVTKDFNLEAFSNFYSPLTSIPSLKV